MLHCPGLNQQSRLNLELDAERTARNVLVALIALELLLVLLDYLINFQHFAPTRGVRRMFNLAREDSIGTWFAAAQVGAISVVLLFHRLRTLEGPPWIRRAWTFLCGFFLYMSVDDGAKIHERVGSAAKKVVAKLEQFPSYTWQAVYAPLLGFAFLVMLWLAWKDMKKLAPRVLILVGLTCYVLAVGMDFVEGMDGAFKSMSDVLGMAKNSFSHLMKVTEEFIEMAGSTALLVGFLLHLLQRTDTWTLSVRSKEQ